MTQTQKEALRVLFVIVIIVILVLAAVYYGTTLPRPQKQLTESQQIRDADQALLTQMLSKLANLTDNKAAQVALQLRETFKQMGGLFTNTSAEATISLQRTYLCGNSTHANPFARAGFLGNYSAICSWYSQTAAWSERIDTGQNSTLGFQSAFNGLMWSLIELDNLIAKDP